MMEPIHPGKVLLNEFLKPRKMTQNELAKRMSVNAQLINTLVKGKRTITPRTAILLSRVFGNRPQFWLHLQMEWDLFLEEQNFSERQDMSDENKTKGDEKMET